MNKMTIIAIILLVVIIAAVAWGPLASNVEQAPYTVIESHGSIEIRKYPEIIVAETTVSGERNSAIEQGFRTLAGYIFGKNKSGAAVATRNVAGENMASEKIAMTAPVMQQSLDGKWQVRFVMHKNYDMNTLPKPVDDNITIKKIIEKKYAVIRFSGIGNDESLAQNLSELNRYILSNGLRPLSEPAYAFFNPPWTLPMLRRNEIMIEVAS
jgi:effector-binding domain-containing protein